MIHPSYPHHEFRIRKQQEIHQIFCEGRRKWVKLTPEEWVRQNGFQWFTKVLQYPPSLIAIEKELDLFGLTKRFDMLVYDRRHQPWMMVECKQQSQPLSQKVLMQALRYNLALPVPFLVLTNGTDVRLLEIKENNWSELFTMPEYE